MDGPSGTGKSTVSRAVAERLGIPHLDTGAFYRAATLAAIRARLDPSDAERVSKAVSTATLDQNGGRMYLDGVDVSSEIREPEVTAQVSQVSAHPAVRRLLVAYQREWVRLHGGRAVVEGRDIGSVVFPDADVKIYLDATAEVRARRRAIQEGADPSAVLDDIRRRDHLDSSRKTSPLAIPDQAHVIDTSHLDFDEVVDRVLELALAADASD